MLDHVLDRIDLILVMSVNPGFGNQRFIPGALDKLRTIRAIIDAAPMDIRLEIDGGVKTDNIGDIADAGADTFVAGSAIFGSNDYAATIGSNESNCRFSLIAAGSAGDRLEYALGHPISLLSHERLQ